MAPMRILDSHLVPMAPSRVYDSLVPPVTEEILLHSAPDHKGRSTSSGVPPSSGMGLMKKSESEVFPGDSRTIPNSNQK